MILQLSEMLNCSQHLWAVSFQRNCEGRDGVLSLSLSLFFPGVLLAGILASTLFVVSETHEWDGPGPDGAGKAIMPPHRPPLVNFTAQQLIGFMCVPAELGGRCERVRDDLIFTQSEAVRPDSVSVIACAVNLVGVKLCVFYCVTFHLSHILQVDWQQALRSTSCNVSTTQTTS